MKRNHHSFGRLDQFIDSLLGYQSIKKLLSIGKQTGIVVVALIMGLCVLHMFMTPPRVVSQRIASDMDHISYALSRVHSDCSIVAITQGLHPLRFLTMNQPSMRDLCGVILESRERWDGPYMRSIPQQGGIAYQMLTTKHGSWIVPGNGSKLPSGMVVGQDIVWSHRSDMDTLTSSGGALFVDGVALARKIDTHDFVAYNRVSHINATLQDFNAAMELACADQEAPRTA